eukprot:1335188-Rhodomonas_salina.1
MQRLWRSPPANVRRGCAGSGTRCTATSGGRQRGCARWRRGLEGGRGSTSSTAAASAARPWASGWAKSEPSRPHPELWRAQA